MIAAPLALGSLASILGPARAASVTTGAASAATSAAGIGDSFTSLLASFASGTADKLKGAESTSIAGLQGRATTQAVVEAIMSAQEQLQTALAVRDKTVAAFQDVTRMAI